MGTALLIGLGIILAAIGGFVAGIYFLVWFVARGMNW
jgi:hypothetical protein